jgi:hypothetical protein
MNRGVRSISLAEYRLLTVTQIAALTQLGKAAVWNRLNKLAQGNLTVEQTPASTGGRGRPERWVSLSPVGVRWLRDFDGVTLNVPTEDVVASGIRCAEHLLAINWFRIHLVHLVRVIPRLGAQFISSTSPFVECQADGSIGVADYS